MLAMASKPRGERSSVREMKFPAALLTRSVSGPRRKISSIMASTAAASRMSTPWASTLPPCFFISSAAVSSHTDLRRPQMITSAPSARNFSAMPLPSPVPPPVTRIRLPRKSPSVNMRFLLLAPVIAVLGRKSSRHAGLAEIPVEPGHEPQTFAREHERQVLVRGVLRATRIGMRHPDGRQAEEFCEYVVGERAARARQDCGLLAGRACDRGRGPLRAGMVRIETRRVEDLVARLGDLHLGEAVAIEVPPQRRQDFVGIDADHEAELPPRPGLGRHRVHRRLRVACTRRQNLEGRPREYFLGRAEPRLAPGRIDRGAALARMDVAIRKRAFDRIRNAVQHPFRNADLPFWSDDGPDRMGELDRRI